MRTLSIYTRWPLCFSVAALIIISANGDDGIALGGDNNFVQGNYSGTDVNGTADFGNTGTGVLVEGSFGNTIGGTSAAVRNIIAGNGGDGIFISPESAGNQVQGNFIGTQVNGTSALGNGGDGVQLDDSSNIVGGAAAGTGNTIAFNTGNGILVSFGTGNQLLANSIFSNGLLGIDLGGDLVGAADGAMHNRNDNSRTSPSAFEGGHNLHVLRLLPRVVITVPVFPPSC